MIWDNFSIFRTNCAILTSYIRANPRTCRGFSRGCCHVAGSNVESLWRGNWDKNVIESSFMSLDHQRHAIESYVILSDCIFHVIGSYFILLDRTSFYRILYFMLLDRTSFYWIRRHSIGLYFMSLDRTSCHWIRNVIRSGQRLF